MREKINELLRAMSEPELEQIYHLIEAKNRTYHQPLAFLLEVMHFEAIEETANGFWYQMKITDDLRNRYGIVHGGVITTFIDTAMAETAFALDGELKKAVTLDLTVNFVKQAVNGTLRCQVTPTQNSYRLALFTAYVTDEVGDIIATATGHFYKSLRQTQTQN
ncbi:PaaI family thioesterase [Sulfoacidibacillus thermotolerans]|uniref:Thioesterase domain-containing protein n=1 Tax=Sulfoacidibacillus thermotolerans TaxID=1765684 RepID=A0A2U3D6G5_SULT2|nr:PaaI family thioesterase [Sulfoacidibacillus thermotolerans]PWI56865.1 hypothetical protein BM613_11550 [Sulfoacidibacillus thermotolerans]